MQDVRERAMGVLLGLAAGDRIGGPLRMAIRVGESLSEVGCVDVHDIEMRYLRWWHDGAFDTGPTVAQVFSLVASGVMFEQAAIQVHANVRGMTAGCNPAHRSAPLAMCALIDDSELERAAIEEARITHRHPLAGDLAAAVVCLCRALICGASWLVALGQALEGRCWETRDALKIHHRDKLSRNGFAPEVLRAAIHFVDTSPSFPVALARSIDFAGSANYSPVLVGSIGGARWGRSQIEKSLLKHHGDLLPRVEKAARALAHTWQNDCQSTRGL